MTFTVHGLASAFLVLDLLALALAVPAYLRGKF